MTVQFVPRQGRQIIIDNFAGGGGASTGIEWALGRSPDFAVNHDPEAVAMHTANHPNTRHFCQDIWQVRPADVAAHGPIGLSWFSPDCTHHSKARGGKPRENKSRDLAWVVIHYAELPPHLKPQVIYVENVEEFVDWGPLDEQGMPIASAKGDTFRQWVGALRSHGYEVEWRERRACHSGAGTIRKRFCLIARCDPRPVIWTEPKFGDPSSDDVLTGRLRPWPVSADCIDWSIPCPSIFLTREEARALGVKRPLEEATQRRIAAGLRKFVLECADPFILPVTHSGGPARVHSIHDPLRTITTAKRGEFALVAPFITKFRKNAVGHRVGDPLHTITASHSSHHPGGSTPLGLVSSYMVKLRGTCRHGQDMRFPMPTVTASGTHLAEVRAFLVKYFGTAIGQDLRDPLHTVTTKARFGVVTVAGEDWQIADIGMRMLKPRELFTAQGFPKSYIIDPVVNGKPLPQHAQVRMCGNSVSPHMAWDLVAANSDDMAEGRREAAE